VIIWVHNFFTNLDKSPFKALFFGLFLQKCGTVSLITGAYFAYPLYGGKSFLDMSLRMLMPIGRDLLLITRHGYFISSNWWSVSDKY